MWNTAQTLAVLLCRGWITDDDDDWLIYIFWFATREQVMTCVVKNK